MSATPAFRPSLGEGPDGGGAGRWYRQIHGPELGLFMDIREAGIIRA